MLAQLTDYGASKLRLSELHPDVWQATVVRDPTQTLAKLSEVAADRYTYRELDEYTDTIQRYLQTVPLVSKVSRSGVLPEAIYLDYSQQKLAGYGLQQGSLEELLASRNISAPGGVLEIQGKNVFIDPSGELKSEHELGDILVPAPGGGGSPLYLRDLVEISRDYQSPARFLNYLTDHGRCDGARSGTARAARWTALAAAVLRADRRAHLRDVAHAVARAGVVHDRSARPRMGRLGWTDRRCEPGAASEVALVAPGRQRRERHLKSE